MKNLSIIGEQNAKAAKVVIGRTRFTVAKEAIQLMAKTMRGDGSVRDN